LSTVSWLIFPENVRSTVFLIATPILIWFFWSFCRWRHMQTSEMIELEHLDELIDAHETKIASDGATLELKQMIHDLERKYAWSPDLHRQLERARQVLRNSGKR